MYINIARHVRRIVAPLTSTLIAATIIGGAAAQLPSITVNDPRPLAQAIYQFEQMYGFVVTYEDPRFAHLADLARRASRGVTDLIPRGGPFAATIDTPPPQRQQSLTSRDVSEAS